jgi:peptide-methionine (S)-S-oxide reductase
MRRLFEPLKALAAGAAAVLLLGVVVGAGSHAPAFASEEGRAIPAPLADIRPAPDIRPATRFAVLAGGCFWGVQGVFQHVKGVINATSGYAGGEAGTAHYETVGSGRTGHAEAVQVEYDPAKVSYGHLLQIYFSVAHDPTQLNRQGPDSGTQYRSAIFPADAEQAKVAKAYIDQLNGAHVFDDKIVTSIEPGKGFYKAEAYHQDFLNDNPSYPYIVINDLPKIDNLKRFFPADFRAAPVLVAHAG